MKVAPTHLAGLMIIEPVVYGDERGFFMQTYSTADFSDVGITTVFVQDNHSKSAKGVLRGMHFQYHKPQAKLVRVTAGAVYDVVIDLRRNSQTYGQRHGTILSAANKRQLYVPQGFAHGFLALEEGTEFLYKVSDVRDPTGEGGVMRNDPAIGIDRQTILTEYNISEPQLSPKDTTYQDRIHLPPYFTT